MRMGGPARLLLISALTCSLGLAAGCTDTTRPPEQTLPSGGRATSTGPARPQPSHPRPATTAGAMSLSTFPTPVELGPGWKYVRSPTDPDEKYLDNGTPALERDVNDVVKTIIPVGCSRQNPMPMPSWALEVRYAFRDAPVTAFELEFVSPAVAQAFFSLRVNDLEDCTGKTDDSGRDLVGQVISLGDGVVLSERFPDEVDQPRTDLVMLTKTSVILVSAWVRLGAEPFTSGRSVQIAAKFRNGGS